MGGTGRELGVGYRSGVGWGVGYMSGVGWGVQVGCGVQVRSLGGGGGGTCQEFGGAQVRSCVGYTQVLGEGYTQVSSWMVGGGGGGGGGSVVPVVGPCGDCASERSSIAYQLSRPLQACKSSAYGFCFRRCRFFADNLGLLETCLLHD